MGLSVENVSFSYDEVQILRDISFTIDEPCIVGIIGPNGSGKSTLVKNILNLLQPDSGKIYYDSVDVTQLSLSEKAKMVSYVPQSMTPNFSHTVFYTVLMGRKPYIGWSYTDGDKSLTDDILADLNLQSLRNRMFSQLSGGEKQKTILARAIAQNCKVMVLDEPTSNLDLRHQKEVLDYLRNLSREDQIMVLIVIHDLNLASMYCDKIILLDDGKKAVEGSPSQVITQENLLEYYRVDVDIINTKNGPRIILSE